MKNQFKILIILVVWLMTTNNSNIKSVEKIKPTIKYIYNTQQTIKSNLDRPIKERFIILSA